MNQNDFHGIIVKILRSFEYERSINNYFTSIISIDYYRNFYATNKKPIEQRLWRKLKWLERSKARGFEAVMQRLTAIMIFFWLLIAMILMVLSSR